MPLPPLDHVAKREIGGVIRCGCEGVSSGLVGEIVEAAATDIGNVDAKLDLLALRGVGNDVCGIEVILGAPRVGLCTSTGEGTGNDELGILVKTVGLVVKVADEKMELVEKPRGKDIDMAHVDLVFEEQGICACRR